MKSIDSGILSYVKSLIKDKSRKNDTCEKYWYPLNYATYGAEEISSALESLISFKTSMANKTLYLENEFSYRFNCKYTTFLNSGSSADLIAIRSTIKSPLNSLKEGDKVLVPAITWPTQIWSIIQARLIPVLFDCCPLTFNPDISSIPEDTLIEAKAIFTTHILGTCSDMDLLINICDSYDLLLIEDTCESFGSKYKDKLLGTFGIAGTFSSFFSHHITTLEGGFMITNDQDIDSQAKLLRSHGWSRSLPNKNLENFTNLRSLNINDFDEIDNRYMFIDEGYNLRPTEIGASFGIHQLEKSDRFMEKRKELAAKFYMSISNLKTISGPSIVEGCDPSFMALPLTIRNGKPAKIAITFLEEHGIESRPLIAGNMLRHPVAKNLKLISTGNLVGADHHHFHSFYIGLTPMHSLEDIEKLAKTLKKLDYILSV